LKSHKYDIVEKKVQNDTSGNPTSKEMKLKIAFEDSQTNFKALIFLKN